MTSTTSASGSLWLEADPPPPTYPPLRSELGVDVAVVGGGIAGLTTALLLKREGVRVAVIEAERVGTGVTGCNTAKVSALQATILTTVRSRHGEEAAAVYAQASREGVEQIAKLAAEEEIDCDLARRPAFTYAAEPGQLGSVEREHELMLRAGLPSALTDEIDLPFEVAGAVRLDDQIAFHPVRYARGLARAIDGDGSVVLERTRARAVEDGSPCRIRTSSGSLRAEQVVIATHYPMLDRGLFFARLKPERSYCIAARVRGGLPQGMSISVGTPTGSVRSYGNLLIIGGEGHQTGARSASPERFEQLERFARRHWEVEQVTHRWSAQDASPYDHLPVIGRYSPFSSRVFVASGFMKWGLSGGTVAGMLLRDLIAGRANAWAERFDPNRVSLRSAPELAQLNAKVGFHFLGGRLKPALAGTPDRIPRGEARVVRSGLGQIGVYRDEDDALHAVSLRCTHLGCLLRFNSAERSWDCPCHGSRFDVDGGVLEGPAVEPLERKTLGG